MLPAYVGSLAGINLQIEELGAKLVVASVVLADISEWPTFDPLPGPLPDGVDATRTMQNHLGSYRLWMRLASDRRQDVVTVRRCFIWLRQWLANHRSHHR